MTARGAATLAALVTVPLAACAGVDGSDRGAIRENVVEPGITAIAEDAPAAMCGLDEAVLRTAIDAYTTLEGDPPSDEQALVDAELLREPSEGWDVVDGELVAVDPACGAADAPITTVDIVTEAEPLDADELYATFDAVQIESVGGEACARELAEIVAGGETYLAELGIEPDDLDDLVDAGYLDGLPELWVLDGGRLVPADDSGCADLG